MLPALTVASQTDRIQEHFAWLGETGRALVKIAYALTVRFHGRNLPVSTFAVFHEKRQGHEGCHHKRAAVQTS
jgi:hypothetical protein